MRNKKIAGIVFAIIIVLLLIKPLIGVLKFSPVLFGLLFNKEVSLKKADDNINILLLGIGGGTHEGPNLSDTMIFASINPVKNKTTLVSIPRDMWVSDLGAKINTAYAQGEKKRKGGGLILAKAAVSKIVGEPIDYGFRIDFSGFVKAVDMIGGLDVATDRTLDDNAYPIEGKEDASCGHSDEEIKAYTATVSAEEDLSSFFVCRYKSIHFPKGENRLNGEQALEFVRSRHALGLEGSDFARSARQEKVIKAFKDKVLSVGTLLNPGKVFGLYDILQSSIDTDIKQDEFDDFIRLFGKLKTAKIESAVVDYGDSFTQRPGLLVNPPLSQDYNGAWVLIPRIGSGDFSEIQKYVDCEIKVGNCPISQTPNK